MQAQRTIPLRFDTAQGEHILLKAASPSARSLRFIGHDGKAAEHPEIADCNPGAGKRIDKRPIAQHAGQHRQQHAHRHGKRPAGLGQRRFSLCKGPDLRSIQHGKKHPEQDERRQHEIRGAAQKQRAFHAVLGQKHQRAGGHMEAARAENQISQYARAKAVRILLRIRRDQPVNAKIGKPLQHHAQQAQQRRSIAFFGASKKRRKKRRALSAGKSQYYFQPVKKASLKLLGYMKGPQPLHM